MRRGKFCNFFKCLILRSSLGLFHNNLSFPSMSLILNEKRRGGWRGEYRRRGGWGRLIRFNKLIQKITFFSNKSLHTNQTMRKIGEMKKIFIKHISIHSMTVEKNFCVFVVFCSPNYEMLRFCLSISLTI